MERNWLAIKPVSIIVSAKNCNGFAFGPETHLI